MVRHNLLLIYRTFKRFKTTFFINLTGLSTGLASALLIYLWVSDELRFDKFHENDSRLFQVVERVQVNNKTEIVPHTAGLLGETIEESMPEVEYVVSDRLLREDKILSVGDKNIKARGLYATKDFFNMFSYGLMQGDKDQVLAGKSGVVISEELATKLFNTSENVVGKSVELQHEKPYMVSGVFKETPPNSSMQFDFALSYEEFKKINPNALNWRYNSAAVYVVLKEGSDVRKFNAKIAGLVNSRTGDSLRVLTTRPYSEPYLYGNYENGVRAGGRIEYVRLFSVIAIFILLIACINFMNLSTAKASGRLKEVGVKKTLGAGRKTLIHQYFSESMAMAFLSLVVAILLVELFLPRFTELTGKNLSLGFDLNLVLSVLGITLITGLIAGSYPALYLSGVSPATVMKGKVNRFVGEVWARKGLVIFQFTLSIILAVGVLVVYKQIAFVQTKNLGYEKDNILYFDIEGRVAQDLETFLSEIRSMPGIVNASSIGQNIVGSGLNTFSIDNWEGKKADDRIVFEMRPVSYDMIETLGIQMAAGRSYSRDFGSEDSKIIFNQAAIEAMGLEDPIGKMITIQGSSLEIIGVTKNFHFASLHEEVNPLFFVLRPSWTRKIMVKLEAGREKEIIDRLQNFYQAYNPGFPFAYQFLDEAYQAQYAAEQRVSILSRYFAGFAILISCLGLFGLVAFTTERRLKEIGIRKILGSSELGIVRLLSGDFTKMVAVAIVVALPAGYYITKNWLDNFAYRIDLQWWFFAGPGLLALFIAWFTVALQTLKAARISPTQSLKNE
ncbi:MAG TPA: ABC transporter permease [Chryseosolibacter sp.]